MHITYITTGSDGDIRPAIALSVGLQKAGHRVSLVTTPDYEASIVKRGLEHIAIADDELANFIPAPPKKEFLHKLWTICQGSDAIICSNFMFLCSYIAEKLKIPCYIASMIPFSPTRNFPFAYISSRLKLGKFANWISYYVFDQLLWQSLRKPLNQWREKVLDLTPLPYWLGTIRWIQQKQIPCLYSHSPALLPKQSDWSDRVYVTGYWFLDSSVDWQPPKDLVEFLEVGSPPVYIGFGNYGDWNSTSLAKIVLEALSYSGQRAILLSGKDFSDRSQLPKEVFPIEWASFEWLFPRMAAVIHHGGLGTIHAALKAGVPSVIIPTDEENFFWGNRLVELGLSPPLIKQKQLSAEKLAEAINFVVTNKSIRKKAAEIGKQVRREDGVATAVEIFHQHLLARACNSSKRGQELTKN
jgi:sterol 3beta-glucosyltransferase